MDPYLVSELKAYLFTTVAGFSVIAGGLLGWLGSLISSRILRVEEARQRLRIELYREAVNPFIELYVTTKLGALSPDAFREFERTKLRAACGLGLFASQDVMYSFAQMADYVSDVLEGTQERTEARTIGLMFAFLNTARQDIRLGKGTVVYGANRALSPSAV